MMSARAYATKYPGKVVKLSAYGLKEAITSRPRGRAVGVADDEPIGIIVGWKAGRLGIVGSSKVVVYHDKYGRDHGLEVYTDRMYNPVTANAPDRRKGIYLLSVNYIEQFQTEKPVLTYPHHCRVCGQPARRGANIVVCSNKHCKSRKALLAAIGPIPKFYITDKEGFILCPTCQIQDKIQYKEHDFASDSHGHRNIVCRKKQHAFTHIWKEGHKIFHQGTAKYIWKNGQLTTLPKIKNK
jgi:hypothetical protein